MNMNFNQIAMIQKLKGCMDRFRMNHPKFPLFLNTVSQDALIEGAVVEITVTTPQGKNYCSSAALTAARDFSRPAGRLTIILGNTVIPRSVSIGMIIDCFFSISSPHISPLLG